MTSALAAIPCTTFATIDLGRLNLRTGAGPAPAAAGVRASGAAGGSDVGSPRALKQVARAPDWE